MYSLLRPLLFRLDSEVAHDSMLSIGELMAPFAPLIRLLGGLKDPRLAVQVGGMRWPNPVGLAAGFDKDARILALLSALGFGAIEVGSITSEPQPGNPKPRMFRLPADRALINRMGFPSAGVAIVSQRLSDLRPIAAALGVNIGKAKSVELDRAAEDYLATFTALKRFGDYFVINVSSPNTVGLRTLQDRDKLEHILKTVQQSNDTGKPLFVKLSPDLTEEQTGEALESALAAGVNGVIATNTTTLRDGLQTVTAETGGLSGRPLFNRALERVRFISRALNGKLPVIGVGGVASADDLLAMLRAGASAVQLYSALVYEGPFLAARINRELLRRIDAGRFANLAELVAQR